MALKLQQTHLFHTPLSIKLSLRKLEFLDRFDHYTLPQAHVHLLLACPCKDKLPFGYGIAISVPIVPIQQR